MLTPVLAGLTVLVFYVQAIPPMIEVSAIGSWADWHHTVSWWSPGAVWAVGIANALYVGAWLKGGE